MKLKRYCSFASLSLVVIGRYELLYVFDDYKLAIELSWILLNVAYMMEFFEELLIRITSLMYMGTLFHSSSCVIQFKLHVFERADKMAYFLCCLPFFWVFTLCSAAHHSNSSSLC